MKVSAMVHSKNAVEEVELLEKTGDNAYLVKVGNVICTAIFNWFTGLYYADDKYGVVKRDE